MTITTLFLDIGGVLLTNGWGHQARQPTAKEFDLDWDEIEDRLMFVQIVESLGFEVLATRTISRYARN